MTTVSQTPFNEHTGNGVSVTFGFTFQLLTADDLKVYIDGALVADSEYSISGLGVQAGGSVTFDSAPVNGTTVLLSRELELARDTDYQRNGDLPEATLDNDFDRLWQAMQQQNPQIGGILKAPYPEQVENLPSATDRAGYFLAFDSNGDPISSAGTGADAGLRTDLASTSVSPGAALVGVRGWKAGMQASTADDLSRERVSVFRFLTASQKADVESGSPVLDHTTQLQAAFDALGDGIELDFPVGYRYNIDGSPLLIPSGAVKFALRGNGKTELRQMADNTPIIQFEEEGSYYWNIDGFIFSWGDGDTPVLETDTLANGIVFSGDGTTGAGFYDWSMRRLRCRNGMHLITTDPAKSGTTIGFWGGSIRDIFMESLSRGSAIRMRDMAGGYPAVNVDRLYDIAPNRIARTIDIQAVDTWMFRNIERNRAGESVTNTPALARITSGRNIHLNGVRFENEHYKGSSINNSGLISFENTTGSVKGISWTAPEEFNLANGTSLLSTYNNSGDALSASIDDVHIEKVNGTAISAFTSGKLFVFYPVTSGGSPMKTHMGKNIVIAAYQSTVGWHDRDTNIYEILDIPTVALQARETSVTGSKSFTTVPNIMGVGSGWYIDKPRTIVSLIARSSGALSGSSLKAYLYKNGSAIGTGSVSVTIANGATASPQLDLDPSYQPSVETDHQLAYGDLLQVRLETPGGGTLSSTTDITVTIGLM